MQSNGPITECKEQSIADNATNPCAHDDVRCITLRPSKHDPEEPEVFFIPERHLINVCSEHAQTERKAIELAHECLCNFLYAACGSKDAHEREYCQNALRQIGVRNFDIKCFQQFQYAVTGRLLNSESNLKEWIFAVRLSPTKIPTLQPGQVVPIIRVVLN